VAPPFKEQVEIAAQVDVAIGGIAGALDRARREIVLFCEFRTRLIADVVTGKLDVREAAWRLPDEAGDTEPLDDAEAETDNEETADDSDAAAAEEAEA
jgi:type I restriction enzyme S subunit